MRYATTLLIWASLIVNEVHTFFENIDKEASWILTKDVPMLIQWNVKFIGDEVSGLLIALALLLYKKNRINDTTVKVFVAYWIIDLLLYFYDYKQPDSYKWVYLVILILWVLIYNHATKRSRAAERQRIIIETE
jgi:hypothetical protein